MSNVHVLQGLGAILNGDNLKPGIDVREIERRMISGGLIEKVRDPHERFSEEMRETAKKIGINFAEFFGDARESETADSRDYDDRYEETAREEEEVRRRVTPPRVRSPSPPPASDSDDDDRAEDDIEPAESLASWRNESRPRSRLDTPRPSDLRSYTFEQARREHINQVSHEMGADPDFSFEQEKLEDQKTAMLEEIDSLWTSLLDEDIDLTRITQPDQDSSYDEVKTVLKMLRYKNDRSRYCSFAEEFLLFGAYGLEELFDGQRTWFGRYRPDLRGWHSSVNVKLRRMRHDTSTLMSSVMGHFNIGPAARLILELVPNMVLHSKMRKQQYGAPGMYNDPALADAEMAQATERIRGLGG